MGKVSGATDVTEDYRKIAEQYMTLAEAEERHVGKSSSGSARWR
jgi:hypothetical protein